MPDHNVSPGGLIEGFIDERVTQKGLDGRTEKAYRLDLERFTTWLDQKVSETNKSQYLRTEAGNLEDWMEAYLDYLTEEKKLSPATICRKNRVFGYYLSYLARQGVIARYRTLRPVRRVSPHSQDKDQLSKKEADAFFAAMEREYEELDNKFRRRICLRDLVMMELLFYHKIEISELLRLEAADYDQKTGVLTIRRKRGENSAVYLFSRKLRGRMEQWLTERENIFHEGECCERMFLSKFGKQLSMKMVIKIFDKYKDLAGIQKNVTPKDLKESCMKQYARELVMEMRERE